MPTQIGSPSPEQLIVEAEATERLVRLIRLDPHSLDPDGRELEEEAVRLRERAQRLLQEPWSWRE